MKNILKGEKLSIDKEIGSKEFTISIKWQDPADTSYDIDSSVMLLSERGKMENESDFIFYNNNSSLNNEVHLKDQPYSGYKKSFDININKISHTTSKIMFLLTIEDGDELNKRFNNVKNICVDILDKNQEVKLSYTITDMTKETAIILLELYKRNDEWKLQGVGNGFNSGLAAIIKEYGSEKVQVEEETPKRAGTFEQKEEPRKPSISLEKINLDKKGASTNIDLNKYDSNQNKEIHINLNWNQLGSKSGFFRKTEKLDLDLGCMFETDDGYKAVIQALGNAFGSKYNFPFIYLDKDDRSGEVSDGENLYILRPDMLRRAAIFAFIYEGNADFVDADAVLTIKGLNREITVKLDSPRPNRTMCIGAYIENKDGVIKIEKIDEYVFSHKDCDEMFGFNFRWVAGSKD
jgi:tellurite resistance protein TerA